MSSKWAPDNAEGLHAYVVHTSEMLGYWKSSRIEYAESLQAARRQFGHTRQLHTAITVRRATPADVAVER